MHLPYISAHLSWQTTSLERPNFAGYKGGLTIERPNFAGYNGGLTIERPNFAGCKGGLTIEGLLYIYI